MSTHIMNGPAILTQLPINNTEEQMPQFLEVGVRDATTKTKKVKHLE